MGQSIDPMEYWYRCIGHDLIRLPDDVENHCTCLSCGAQDRPTIRMGSKVGGEIPSVCVYCMSIRIRYPSSKGTLARLGAGTFALASDDRSVIWTSFRVPQSPRYAVEPIAGRFADVLRDFILNPPTPPYLFVAFARRNEGSSFRINTSQDTVWVSGGGLKIANRLIEHFDRVRVAEFLNRYGDVKKDFFRSLAAANLARYSGDGTELFKLAGKDPRTSDILKVMPVIGSPEFTLISSLLQ